MRLICHPWRKTHSDFVYTGFYGPRCAETGLHTVLIFDIYDIPITTFIPSVMKKIKSSVATALSARVQFMEAADPLELDQGSRRQVSRTVRITLRVLAPQGSSSFTDTVEATAYSLFLSDPSNAAFFALVPELAGKDIRMPTSPENYFGGKSLGKREVPGQKTTAAPATVTQYVPPSKGGGLKVPLWAVLTFIGGLIGVSAVAFFLFVFREPLRYWITGRVSTGNCLYWMLYGKAWKETRRQKRRLDTTFKHFITSQPKAIKKVVHEKVIKHAKQSALRKLNSGLHLLIIV